MITGWKVFIDGACHQNPGRGGFGCIIANEFGVTELGGHEPATTNNRMEMAAAIHALNELHDVPAPIEILTDSEYLAEGMTRWLGKWIKNDWVRNKEAATVKNRDLWEQLHDVIAWRKSAGHGTFWTHVHGHAGIAGNERADQIASAFAWPKSIELYDGRWEGYLITQKQFLATQRHGI
jgi:ribonuclease HI